MITDSDKLYVLENALNKYGLSLDMPDVKHFFYDKRYVEPTMQMCDKNNVVHSYRHSPYIKPTKMSVVPMDFENASYGRFNNLMDWYLYENHESNPLVWKNVGDPSFDVKSSFEKSKQLDSVKLDIRGNLFNSDDGNHRLLTLMINHFLERSVANRPLEKQEVENRYKMEIDVSYPFSDELCDLLSEVAKEYLPYSPKEVVPKSVRDFRFRSFGNIKDANSCVTYDRKTDTLSFNLNGERFVGKEHELINYLKHRQKQTESIMLWQAEGIYYTSFDSYIFKSKDKNKILELFYKIKRHPEATKDFIPTEFLSIKDIDKGTFDILSSGYYIEDKKKADKYAQIIDDILNSDYRETFLTKLQDRKFYEDAIQENVDWAFTTFGGFSMPDLSFKDLTRQEFEEKHYMFCQLEDDYNWIVEENIT